MDLAVLAKTEKNPHHPYSLLREALPSEQAFVCSQYRDPSEDCGVSGRRGDPFPFQEQLLAVAVAVPSPGETGGEVQRRPQKHS